jgi:hypothetical protein
MLNYFSIIPMDERLGLLGIDEGVASLLGACWHFWSREIKKFHLHASNFLD